MSKSADPMGGFDKLPDSTNKNVEPEEDVSTVSKVQQHLKKFGGAKDDLDIPPIPQAKKKSADESESTPEDKPAEEDDSTPESDGEPAADEKDGNKEKPAIPDNHYRALIHQGWDAAKISKVYEKDAELLLELAEKAYSDVNNLSQQFANLGRARIKMEEGQKGQQPQQPQQPQVQPQQGPTLEQLREKHEQDPFGAMVDLVKMFTQPQQPQQSQVQQPAVSREQFNEDLALTQHLIHFFGNEDMKPYNDFYGPMYDENGQPYLTADHLTPGQAANRWRVEVEADRIIAGAALQGTDMPIQQALAMAHMVVSSPIAKQIARKELAKAVKKKAKGVTLEPSARKTVPPKQKEGEGKPEKELEKDTEARIQRYKEGKPLK